MGTTRTRHIDDARLAAMAVADARANAADQKHLAGCPACRGQLAMVRDLRAAGWPRPAGPCPDSLSLSRLAEGDLGDEASRPLRSHLSACSACTADVEDLAAMAAAAGAPPGLPRSAVPGVLDLLGRLKSLVRFEMPLSVALVARGTAARQFPRYEMAMRAYREGTFERALSELETALEEGESGAALHFHLGALYLQAARADEAAEHCARAVRAEPKRAAYRWLLAQSLLAAGRGKEAAAELARVAKMPGPHAEQAMKLRREVVTLLKSAPDE